MTRDLTALMTTERGKSKHNGSLGKGQNKLLTHSANSPRAVHFQEDVNEHDHVQQQHPGMNHEKNCGSDNDEAIMVDALGRQIDSSLSLGESLSINLGMLKCGFRYVTTVNIPFPSSLSSLGECAQQQNPDDTEGSQSVEAEADHGVLKYPEMVNLVTSIDEDLRAEIVEIRKRDQNPICGDNSEENTKRGDSSDEDKISSNNDDGPEDMSNCVVVLRIELAARRPGPYRGRFALKWASKENVTNANEVWVIDEKEEYTFLQIDAVLMDKDKGTPCLKVNIRCTGKLAGYDSDEDTDWQGFD